MAEQQLALTAIRDAAAEGFVATTLFSQGWDIQYRALDYESLISYLRTTESLSSILLISTDCEGLTQDGLGEISTLVQKVILCHTTTENQSDFSESIPLPHTALDLISLLRGSLRTPMIRPQKITSSAQIAKIIAVASVSGGLGCTTFTFNLAFELALLGKRVLLLDAHALAPSLTAILGQRGLHTPSEYHRVSQNLWASEATEENIVEWIGNLDRALTDFDFILFDLGTLIDLRSQLSSRRWTGQALIWLSRHADELMVMAPADRAGLHRLRALCAELSTNSMRPAQSFIHIARQHGKRNQAASENFLKVVIPLRPKKIIDYPFDPRSAHKAELDESSLYDSHERSLLRRMIAELAGELSS